MGPSDVLVRVEYSSVSVGTERWCLTAGLEIPGQPPLAFPHVAGYQAAGMVLGTGRDVSKIKPGDRVFSRNCREPSNYKGSWWGGHVGFHVTDAQSVIPLPGGVSTFEASSLLLAQVGYNGASKPRVQRGDVALVIGEGLVGQYAGQVLRHRGAYVIIAGLNRKRLSIAAQYSADEVFDNSDGTLGEYIRENHPQGVPIVLDTASTNRTVRLGTELLSRNGQLVMNGFYPPSESRIDWHWLRRKEITIYCPDSRTRERLEATLDLVAAGHMHVKELVTHTRPVSEAPDMYRMLLEQSADYLGIVFDWQSI
jgi:3-hydroxyethyl bacteriochlorophyllide a dehydrogenase